MNHGIEGENRAKTEIDPVVIKVLKTENQLVVRGEWKAENLPESSGFPWFSSIISFFSFFTCKYIFLYSAVVPFQSQLVLYRPDIG